MIRDYAVNDYAMIRFTRDAKLGERFYVRQDGTRAYYFYLGEWSKNQRVHSLIFDELQKKLCSCSKKSDLSVDQKSICTGRPSIIKNLYASREHSFRLGSSENDS